MRRQRNLSKQLWDMVDFIAIEWNGFCILDLAKQGCHEGFPSRRFLQFFSPDALKRSGGVDPFWRWKASCGQLDPQHISSLLL